MQIVYISNRPEDLEGTLPYVRAFMGFVSEVVVFCPGAMVSRFQQTGASTVIDERDLLKDAYDDFRASKDHQKMNYMLRASLSRHEHTAEEFLMSDDDSRPIVPVTPEFYKSEGKYHSYYFYTLEKWKGMASKLPVQTSFDIGHFEELRLLRAHSMSTWMFSSHMPQIFNKALFKECTDYFSPSLKDYSAIDEWGTYFNYALSRHATRFHEPSIFRTLAWPHNPDSWPWQFSPPSFAFENFHEELYLPEGLFRGLKPRYDAELHLPETLIKVRRYTEAYMNAKSYRAKLQGGAQGDLASNKPSSSALVARPTLWQRLRGGPGKTRSRPNLF